VTKFFLFILNMFLIICFNNFSYINEKIESKICFAEENKEESDPNIIKPEDWNIIFEENNDKNKKGEFSFVQENNEEVDEKFLTFGFDKIFFLGIVLIFLGILGLIYLIVSSLKRN